MHFCSLGLEKVSICVVILIAVTFKVFHKSSIQLIN